MKHLLASMLLALTAITSFASPAQEERHQFCYATASIAYEVVVLKGQGLTREMFETQLNNLISEIRDEFSATDLNLLQHLLRQAYAQGGSPAARATEAYETCMNVKQT